MLIVDVVERSLTMKESSKFYGIYMQMLNFNTNVIKMPSIHSKSQRRHHNSFQSIIIRCLLHVWITVYIRERIILTGPASLNEWFLAE